MFKLIHFVIRNFTHSQLPENSSNWKKVQHNSFWWILRQIVLSCTFCYHIKVTVNKRSRNLPDQSLVSCLNIPMDKSMFKYKTMITLNVEENNPITPKFYNNLISNLQFHKLTCPFGHSGCLSIHGYYNRYIKTSEGKKRFRNFSRS